MPKQLSAPQSLSRRGFFDRFNDGISGMALAYLLNTDLYGGSGLLAAEQEESVHSVYDLKPRCSHFEPNGSV